jgi:hypothetical protein
MKLPMLSNGKVYPQDFESQTNPNLQDPWRKTVEQPPHLGAKELISLDYAPPDTKCSM